jgi:uncharacterized protein YjbI with pentapeptide repeats
VTTSHPSPEARRQDLHDLPPLRELSSSQLEQILGEHRQWVLSRGKVGKRANLMACNLAGRDFTNACLRRANLIGANLTGAILIGADLSEAYLEEARLVRADLAGANLRGAILSKASLDEAYFFGTTLRGAMLYRARLNAARLQKVDLRETNLQDADLMGATDLLGTELAGANVTGAKLPEPVLQFGGLAHINEVSRRVQPLLLAMLLACVYAWLITAMTTDVALLTNAAASPLPLLGVAVPVAGLYWTMPFLLFGVYIYVVLYLQRLWELLAGLPAIFPDGRPIDQKVQAWMLNGIVRGHLKLLQGNRPPFARLQVWLCLLLAWGMVPLTLGVLWVRYLARHDWLGTGIHIGVLTMVIVFAMVSYQTLRATLRGEERITVLQRGMWTDLRLYMRLGVVIAAAYILFYLSYGGINGVRQQGVHDWPDGSWFEYALLSHRGTGPSGHFDVRRWMPKVLSLAGFSPFAQLEAAEVSARPVSWRGQQGPDLPAVKGARLQGRDLRFAEAQRAFLVNADLRRATLQYADLRHADLRGANLQQADLRHANLHAANLEDADLLDGNFAQADLAAAIFGDVSLQGVNLTGADLRGTDLSRVGHLTHAQVVSAITDEHTRLPEYLVGPPSHELFWP